jgi:hypothetical protein
MPFDPSSLSSTLSWWDAADTTTITTSAANIVSGWADKIGNHAPFINGDFSTGMNTGIEVVNGLNTISSIGSNGNGSRYQGLRQGQGGITAVPYQVGFPGAAGTMYMVVQIDISASGSNTFTVRDVAQNGRWMAFNGNDNYHLYYYGSFQANQVNVNRHGLEFPNNSYMDGRPHIWKMTWDATSGIARTTFDGGNPKFVNGYTNYGSTSWQGIEINTNTVGPVTDKCRFCELSLHNVVIPEGSEDDARMLTYFRNKWGTPGRPTVATSTAVVGALSGGSKVRSLQISNDGTLVMSTDAPNCWKWVEGTTHRFTNLFHQDSLPNAFDVWGIDTYFQCYEIGIAPTNSSRLYAVANLSGGNGQIWKSMDGGLTWTDLNQSIPFARHDPGPSIGIDPANPDHVMIGASNGHIFETFNAGTSWTDRTISGGGTSYACIAFDTLSGTTIVSGVSVTVNVYIGWSAGAASIFRSTNGGVNFSTAGLLGTGPATARCLVCGADGTVYVCDNSGSTTNAWKFAASTWTHFVSGAMTATGSTWVYCAINRLISNNRVAFLTGDCKLQYTADAGTNFYGTSAGTPFVDFDEMGRTGWTVNPYHGNTQSVIPPNFGFNYVWAGSRLAFSNSGNLYMGSGVGVFYTDPHVYLVQTTPVIHWTQQNDGAPGFEMTDLVKNYANSVDVYADTAYTLKNYVGTSTTGAYTEPTYFVGGSPADGWAVDYDKTTALNASHHFMVTATNLRHDVSYGANGYDENQGVIPGFIGPAMMAAVDNNNLTVISNGGCKFTSNRGGAWNNCLFGGVAFTFAFGKTHTLVCDGLVSASSTLYFIRPDTGGCWRSINNGATWSVRNASAPGLYTVGGQLCNVPGQTQHLFFAHGRGLGITLRRSVDGGTSWLNVPNVTEAWQVSAGAANPNGTGYPCVYITGIISGDPDPGVFRAETFNSDITNVPTWTRVCYAPAGNMDASNKLFADLNNYGTTYLTMDTSGFVFMELNTQGETIMSEAIDSIMVLSGLYDSRPRRIPQI